MAIILRISLARSPPFVINGPIQYRYYLHSCIGFIGVSLINYRLSSSSDFFLSFVIIFSRYFLCVNAGIAKLAGCGLVAPFPDVHQTLPLPSLHLSCIASYDLRGGNLLGVCSTKRLYRRIKKVCTECLHSLK